MKTENIKKFCFLVLFGQVILEQQRYKNFIVKSINLMEFLMELLNQAANIEAKDNYGNTPLIFGIFLYYCCWILYYELYLVKSCRTRPY
jgi:hypothetical protein